MQIIREGDNVADMNELAREMDQLATNYSKEVVLYAMGSLIGCQTISLDEVEEWMKLIATQAMCVRRGIENGDIGHASNTD